MGSKLVRVECVHYTLPYAVATFNTVISLLSLSSFRVKNFCIETYIDPKSWKMQNKIGRLPPFFLVWGGGNKFGINKSWGEYFGCQLLGGAEKEQSAFTMGKRGQVQVITSMERQCIQEVLLYLNISIFYYFFYSLRQLLLELINIKCLSGVFHHMDWLWAKFFHFSSEPLHLVYWLHALIHQQFPIESCHVSLQCASLDYSLLMLDVHTSGTSI